jgi:hypothetical protein
MIGKALSIASLLIALPVHGRKGKGRMKTFVKDPLWKILGGLVLLTLLLTSGAVLAPAQKAQAHTVCSGITTPCIDVHRNGYIGTIYVDGYHFDDRNAGIVIEYWIDCDPRFHNCGSGKFAPGVYADATGHFSTTIPPQCAYSSVTVIAFTITIDGDDVSNYDSVPSIC